MTNETAIIDPGFAEGNPQEQRSDGQGLAEAFTLCTHRLDCFYHSMTPNHSDALDISLLRLRLSRWGKACNIHEGPALIGDIEDYQDAEKTLHSLLALLDIDSGGGDDKTTPLDRETKSIINTIDAIVARRSALPRAPRSSTSRPKQNGRCLNWSAEQYGKAAFCMDELEQISGVGQLRELSLEEKSELATAHGRGAIFELARAATLIDCWTALHADSTKTREIEDSSSSNPMLDVYLGKTTIDEIIMPPK